MDKNIDTVAMLRIYRAVAGPVAKKHVRIALEIIKNNGKFPVGLLKSEVRTWFRVKESLADHGIL
ncbi:MAG: hypothetical protein II892_13780 [Fibrobacter sp.]|jgi:hypothetical protein|nr:hypothetical protein [Fibrobacter sp.]MBQ3716625.1 hypothetical protein [Fibrobacter sp.]